MITNEWISGIHDIQIALDIRKKVFVDEQGCDITREHDELDSEAVHLIVREGDTPLSTGRVYYDINKKAFKIGRVCVLPEYRNKGIGDLTVKLLIYKALEYGSEVHISAQSRLKGFYERYGFKAWGEEYMEENIPHIYMTLKKEEVIYPSKCGGHN